MMGWRTIESEELLETDFVTVRRSKVELPDGAVIEDFFTVGIQDASMVAALTAEGDILLKKEFRYACGCDVTECPAGMFEKGEEPLDVARRELLEETGYSSDDWTYLGPTLESTSKLTNTMHLFLARNCIKKDEQHLDQFERISLIKVPLQRAVEMVMNGAINANSTAHLILKVNEMMRRGII